MRSLPALVVALLFAVLVAACARSDASVQADLQQQLAADPTTAGITATVTEGVAKLSGVTQTQAQQDRALAIGRAVKGVVAIESTMRIDDAALTEAVKKAIATDDTISAVPLRIEVRDGEVRLFSDQTNADQRARLTQVAGNVYGVTHVEDNMK
jgi:osmotically-inducible protein OsmY